jgi:hypothetical protein
VALGLVMAISTTTSRPRSPLLAALDQIELEEVALALASFAVEIVGVVAGRRFRP